jgi:hypothetical protein
MKSIGFFLVLMLASGCATSPSMSSAQHQFRKEHPDAKIIEQAANDATEHTGYWPHSTTRRYADYTFRYRGADGVEHEEVWHYKYLNHGWSVEKEQTR